MKAKLFCALFPLLGVVAVACSDSRPTFTVPTDAAVVTDAATDTAPEVDPPNCISCSAFLNPELRNLKVCRFNTKAADGSDRKASAVIFNALTDCACQTGCAVECTSQCSGGPTNDVCSACQPAKCGPQIAECLSDTYVSPGAGDAGADSQ